jgi:two-component system sensor histidine kinase BaeS
MSNRASPDLAAPRWYRSLYWRTGIGFVVFLMLVLGIQIVFLAWMVRGSTTALPGGSSWRFAQIVASDVQSRLAGDRQLDLPQYVSRNYAYVPHPFFVLMTDGQLITNRAAPDPSLRQFMRNELGRRVSGKLLQEPVRPFVGRASIVLDGHVAGLVVAPPRAPLLLVIGHFAPILAISGLVVLMVGASVAALLIVRSPHSRLNALHDATRHVAGGDLTARASEEGDDEISALARAFNVMAIELQARADQLRAADQARRQLLADMCHELATPLTAIRGYVEMLLMDGVSFDACTQKSYLGIIEQEADRMHRRISDLLDLARLEAGGGILTIQTVSVAHLFDGVVATFSGDCARKQISLTTTTERGATTVLGDPDRLEQVLRNLTANAVRHTPPRGSIQLRAAARGSSVHITVMDTGEGIPPAHLARVFDRFYKVDPARADRSPGSGLGLSIAKAITERHGGAISVTSRVGETIFEVRLPLPETKEMAPSPLGGAEHLVAAAGRL